MVKSSLINKWTIITAEITKITSSTHKRLWYRNPNYRLKQQTKRNVRLWLRSWLSSVGMYWNKTIVFEEFWPVFLLIAPVRHNKPWRQFENGGTPPRFQTDREKKGKLEMFPNMAKFLIWYYQGVSSLVNGGLREVSESFHTISFRELYVRVNSSIEDLFCS